LQPLREGRVCASLPGRPSRWSRIARGSTDLPALPKTARLHDRHSSHQRRVPHH